MLRARHHRELRRWKRAKESHCIVERGPIAVALAWPERLPLLDTLPRRLDALDLGGVGRLEFEAPDLERFPCLALAYAALRGDEAAPAVRNDSNEPWRT